MQRIAGEHRFMLSVIERQMAVAVSGDVKHSDRPAVLEGDALSTSQCEVDSMRRAGHLAHPFGSLGEQCKSYAVILHPVVIA